LESFNKFLTSDYSKNIEVNKKLAILYAIDYILNLAKAIVNNLAKSIKELLHGHMPVNITGNEIMDTRILGCIANGIYVVVKYVSLYLRKADISVSFKGNVGGKAVKIPFFKKLGVAIPIIASVIGIVTIVLDIHGKTMQIISDCNDTMSGIKCVAKKVETTIKFCEKFVFLMINIVRLAVPFLTKVLHKDAWVQILSGRIMPMLFEALAFLNVVIAVFTVFMTLTDAISTGDYSAIFDVGSKPMDVVIFWVNVGIMGLGIAWLLGFIGYTAVLSAIPIVGAVVFAIVFIIWLILNWNAICAWWHGKITEKDRKMLEGEMGVALDKTMKIRASFNTQKLSDGLYKARKQKAASILARRIASTTNDIELSKSMKNISIHSMEYSKAEYRKALDANYAKFWVLPLWRQMTDFVDEKHKDEYGSEGFKYTHANPLQKMASIITFGHAKPVEKHYWNSSIYVLFKDGFSIVLGQHKTHKSIEEFLNNIRPAMKQIWNGNDFVEEASDDVNWTDNKGKNHTVERIEFKITGHKGEEEPNVNADGTKEWIDSLASQTNELQKWMERASSSNDRWSYVGGFPSPRNFSKDYGLLTISKDIGFKAKVTITGSGEILLGQNTTNLPYIFEMNSTERSKSIYMKPGSYSIKWSGDLAELPLLAEGTSFNIVSFNSPDFTSAKAHIGINWTKVVRFTIENNFANSVKIQIKTKDSILKVREDGDKDYVDSTDTFLMKNGEKKDILVILKSSGKNVYLNLGLDNDTSAPGYEIYNDIYLSPGTDRWQYVKIREDRKEPRKISLVDPDTGNVPDENKALKSLLEEYYGKEPITEFTEYYLDFDAKVIEKDWKVTYNFSARLWVNYVVGLEKDPKTQILFPWDKRYAAVQYIASHTYYTVDELIYYYNKELYTKENYLFFYPVYLENY
ncbi:MAG: hypothetical protein AB1779_05610, partial [Candidatus Thermoplasmatota archaeon]